ncbi:DUF4148 domain-containing protein [Burkholderia sp. S171]|uniref:DUF4148 domain-containing protein n=1 Tax=Burkholderia sp. S171 TaxID=1641860 RepID=UPI00131B4832|nr:DUF4148 domain-containing protein [Burkholderia sp. S171]
MRTLLAGLFVGALVIGASVMRSGEDKLAGARSGSQRDNASISGELDNSPVETPRSEPASANGHSDEISHILQAIRDSLKRNDLASAKVLLGAVQKLHMDDSGALTLQKELQAREEKADLVPPVAPPDNPRNTAAPTRSTPRLPARAGRSHESTSPVREHTISTSRRLRITEAAQIGAPSNSGVYADAASPALGVRRTESSWRELAPTTAPTIARTPPRTALTRAKPPTEQTLPPAQPVAPRPPPVQIAQGPKTRAEVRAELERARADGSLPRYGNPNPSGPGGVPSSIKTEFESK